MDANKKIGSYETLFVIDATLSDEEIKAVEDKFTALIAENGTIESVDEWGKRRLAYPIDYKTEGYYVLVKFKSETSFPLELNRLLGINDAIMRSIVMTCGADAKPVAATTAAAE